MTDVQPNTETPAQPATPPTPAASTPPAADPPASTSSDPTFTQAQVDQMVGRRASEAKRAAAKELAEQLGMTVDEAKTLIEERRQAAEAEKTELQKAQARATAAETERDQARSEKVQADRQALIDRKLLAAGVGQNATDQATAEKLLVRARAALAITLPADADADATDAEITETMALIPGLKGAPPANGETPKPRAPSGVTAGAQPPAGGQGTQSLLERGAERVRASRTDRPADIYANLRS